MKYKVGDKVRVREDLEKDEEYGLHIFDDEMEEYKGKQAIIKRVLNTCYALDIDNGIYCWTDEMLEPVAEERQFTKEDFKFGDIVTLRETGKWIYVDDRLLNSMGSYIELSNYDKKMDRKDNFLRCGYVHNDIMKVQRYIHYNEYVDNYFKLETLYERKEEILTEKEKEYLKNIINGYDKEIKYIVKDNQEFKLILKNYCSFYPIIHIDLLKYKFKGINNGRYTLKELGL